MALKNYWDEKWNPVYESNHVSYPETGQVFVQLPLDDAQFSEDEPAINGMWLCYDQQIGAVRKPTGPDDYLIPFIHFSSEKNYNPSLEPELKRFSLAPGSFYPRLGRLQEGDIYTTNCICYDDGEFADNDALNIALADIQNTPLYVVSTITGVPQITATAPTIGRMYGIVTKFYTVPNGIDLGVKIMITKVS